MPVPNWHVVGSNVAFYESVNVSGYFGEATLGAGGAACIAKHGICSEYNTVSVLPPSCSAFNTAKLLAAATMTELRSWLQFSMMWDATRDPVALVAEFVANFYGPIAGPHISEHIQNWEKSVAKLGATLTPANWSRIEAIGGFTGCSCSDSKGHPGHCPGACYEKSWVTPEPVVTSAVALTTALKELALDSANDQFFIRTERVLLSSWWIILMRWDECCEFATAAEIEWPLDTFMNVSLSRWEDAMAAHGTVFGSGACPDKDPMTGVCWNASGYASTNTTGRTCQLKSADTAAPVIQPRVKSDDSERSSNWPTKCCFNVKTALKNDEAVVSKKHIDWYTERCGDVADFTQATCDDAVKFATVTHSSLVDGIMPCCNLLQIDCRTGLLQFNTSEYDFSRFAPFIAAGKTVSVALEGTGDMASCCASADNCTMRENKQALAQQLLELALKYRLSSFTGDWEFDGQKLDFYWAGWNETMTHIAAVLRPHGIGIGNSIASDAESLDACARPGFPGGPGAPDWCPAYRNVPWADVLTDMSTYGLDDGSGDGTDVTLPWAKNGTRGSCPYDPNNDPSVIQYCGGVESRVMNVLHSPIAKVYPDRAPQLSPGLYIGECLTNDTTRTKQGWTQPKLSEFLSFLDTQKITRIGLWCTDISPTSNATDPIGFPCPLQNCEWMIAELQAWKKRKVKGGHRIKSDDAVALSGVTFHKIPAFQKGAGGYAAYGIPSLLSFRGQLLVFAEGRRFSCSDSPGQHDLMCQRSTDSGKSWGNCADSAALVDVSLEYGNKCAGKTTTCGIWDPTPVAETSTGKIFVFFSLSPAKNSGGTRTLMMIESDDLAHTFGPLQNITAEVSPPTTKWRASSGTFTGNAGVQLPSGRLVVPMYHSTPENVSVWPDVIEWQGTLVSDTKGATWRIGALQYAQGTAEGAIVQLFDDRAGNHLLAAMRVDEIADLERCIGPQSVTKTNDNTTHCRMLAESRDMEVSHGATIVCSRRCRTPVAKEH
jgi:hypothetical protein